jgi:hypothetical protein
VYAINFKNKYYFSMHDGKLVVIGISHIGEVLGSKHLM